MSHRYDGKMDTECLQLCDAMNLVPGIETVLSCCGHGEHPYRIWFVAESIDALSELLMWFHHLNCGYDGWNVIAEPDCFGCSVLFMVQGPIGEEAYKQADEIAKHIEAYQHSLTCDDVDTFSTKDATAQELREAPTAE
jgi:hypothetical protein